jgi:hypothetical protein
MIFVYCLRSITVSLHLTSFRYLRKRYKVVWGNDKQRGTQFTHFYVFWFRHQPYAALTNDCGILIMPTASICYEQNGFLIGEFSFHNSIINSRYYVIRLFRKRILCSEMTVDTTRLQNFCGRTLKHCKIM